jgi:hypothetical protein
VQLAFRKRDLPDPRSTRGRDVIGVSRAALLRDDAGRGIPSTSAIPNAVPDFRTPSARPGAREPTLSRRA